jgi:hypothetical protein
MLAAVPASAWADCRARVCNTVAVQEAVVATFVAVPLFQVGYAGAVATSYAAPAAAAPQAPSYDALLAEIKAMRAELAALKQGGPVLAAKAPQPLEFLSAANRCGKCHVGANSKGGFDFSAGLGKLTGEQLLDLGLVAGERKTLAGADMPPKGSGCDPLTDDECRQLGEAIKAARQAAKK